MKTTDEIKDEYANERGRDSWEQYFQWLTLCQTDHDTMQYIHDKVLSMYAKQYIDRVKELESALKCMRSLSMAQGASKEWFEIVEANRLLDK